MTGIDWLYVALMDIGICAAMLICVIALAISMSGRLMRGMLTPKKANTTIRAKAFFPGPGGRIVDSNGNEVEVTSAAS